MTFYELDGTTPMAIPEEKLGQGWLEVLKYIRELRDQVVGEDTYLTGSGQNDRSYAMYGIDGRRVIVDTESPSS